MKLTRTRTLIAGAAAVLIAGVAAVSVAHDGPSGGKHGMHGMKGMMKHGMHGGPQRAMFEYLDANADGALTKDEVKGVIDEKLAAFDQSADESLTLAEFEGLWLDFSRRRMVDMFQRLDDDGDGQITKAEMTRPVDRAFRFADRNEDGSIDPSDMRGMHRR